MAEIFNLKSNTKLVANNLINTIGWVETEILNLNSDTILNRDNTPIINNANSFTITALGYRANVVNIVCPVENNANYKYSYISNVEGITSGVKFETEMPTSFNSGNIISTAEYINSGNNSYINLCFIIPSGTTATISNISILKTNDSIQNQINGVNEKLKNGFIDLEWQDGYLYGVTTGVIQASSQWTCTKKIATNILPIIATNKNFSYQGILYELWKNDIFVGSYAPITEKYYNTSYAENDNIIEFDTISIMMQNATNYTDMKILIKDPISNYIENKNIITKNNIRIICVGDSLTQGDYGSEPMGTQNIHKENYPYFMRKYLDISSDKVCNAGCCGFTPKSWYEEFTDSTHYYYEKWNNYFDTTDKIIIPIMLGTNATLSSNLETSTSTQTGYYCMIIEKLYEITNNKAQIILFGCPWVDATKREANYNNVINNNPIIKNIAEKYHIPFVDTLNELGANSFTTSYLQPIDGLHFGKEGYSRLGTFIGSKIKSLLSFNID